MTFSSYFKNKKRAILIGFPLLITLLYGILSFSANRTNQISPGISKPDVTIAPTRFIRPLIPTSVHTDPPVEYNAPASQKMIKKIRERTPLSYPDQAAEYQLLAAINNKSVVLQNTPQFRIEYINTPDLFMVEILTKAIPEAKQAAKNWFISKGFTRYVMCDLPVVFYLNWGVARELRGQNIIFSPLAEGC